ncbi:cytochrome P450 2G1-like [Lissotriton helveticus]
MDFGQAIFLLLAACFSCLLFKMFRKGKLPPGPTPLPLLGNLLQIKNGALVKYLQSLHEVYGPVFTIYMGARPVVVICGYKALKEAFIDQEEDFICRGSLPVLERMLHGFGVSIANHKRWKQLRQFSIMTLKDFGMGKGLIEDKIKEEAQCMVQVFRNTKGGLCEPSIGLDPAAANVIYSVIFGERYDYEDEEFHTLLNMLVDGFVIWSSIWGKMYDMFPGAMYYLPGPHNRIFKNFLKLENILREQVKLHQETLDSNCPRDFIDCFLIRMEQEKQNESSEFHIDNLISTTMALILGGIETVSNTMKHGFHLLLKYPEVQDKIHDEIQREIGQHRSPTSEDRPKMPYTNAVIHEIHRFCDLFPMGLNHSVMYNTQFRGYTIPKGTDVMPFLTTVLKDPSQFKDPENFNPENFLDKNGGFQKPNAYAPFFIGKRICLGQSLAQTEIFIFLTTILQNFNLKSPIHPKDIDLTPKESGFENMPPPYKLFFVPHQGEH